MLLLCVCKGCDKLVTNPITCNSCEISSHTGSKRLARIGHSWNNGNMICCEISHVLLSSEGVNNTFAFGILAFFTNKFRKLGKI